MQQTLRCKRCGWKKKGDGYFLKLWFNNPLHRCKKCGAKNFALIKISPEEIRVTRRNPENNELYRIPGETAIKLSRYQREKKGNQFTKRDLESGNLMAGYNKNKVNSILEE